MIKELSYYSTYSFNYRNTNETTTKTEEKKFEALKIRIVDEPGTLFYIVHDEGKELIRRFI